MGMDIPTVRRRLFLGAVLLINPSLFNNIFVGIELLVLALAGSWLIIRITKWRRAASCHDIPLMSNGKI